MKLHFAVNYDFLKQKLELKCQKKPAYFVNFQVTQLCMAIKVRSIIPFFFIFLSIIKYHFQYDVKSRFNIATKMSINRCIYIMIRSYLYSFVHSSIRIHSIESCKFNSWQKFSNIAMVVNIKWRPFLRSMHDDVQILYCLSLHAFIRLPASSSLLYALWCDICT